MRHFLLLPLSTLLFANACAAGGDPANAHGALESAPDASVNPAFDLVDVHAHPHDTNAGLVTFMLETAGDIGSIVPAATGQLTGAGVESYVWPTSLDPKIGGFDEGTGILALAITAHPDFDDTPLFDENADGDPANDGADWHSHWVVLVENEACDGGLSVRDVSPGVDALPPTAPGLPIALDSPGMSPRLEGHMASLTVPVADLEDLRFDGVTALLRVNANGEAPLLCVEAVHDIASGNLSMPGRLTTKSDGATSDKP